MVLFYRIITAVIQIASGFVMKESLIAYAKALPLISIAYPIALLTFMFAQKIVENIKV